MNPSEQRWLTGFPRCSRYLRTTAIGLLAFLGGFLTFVVIHRGLMPIVAVIFPQLHTRFYDLAVYGSYPTRQYVSFDLPSPAVNVLQWDDSCNDGYVLIAPYGTDVAHPGPTILDARGELVWRSGDYGDSMNFRMQRYHGEDYLTFWSGNKKGSVGWGTLYMLDAHYDVAHTVQAVGENVKGDLHEFEITEDGTALITVYNKTQADLTGMGWGRSADGWIVDSIFQEIDLASGDLLFEWRASEHFDAAASYYTHPLGGYVESIPFDFYHINSMQKDSRGNYLICSRHLHTITYLNGTTGEPLWSLGGESTDFTDLSDGRASDFKWQHHARWIDADAGLLTVFDNGCAGPLHVDAPYSKGTLIQLDTNKMTATHVSSYTSLGKTRAASQGSVQLLPSNDHMFIGWGSSGAWTEHDRDGTLKCEVHFAASSTFWWERVKDYRSYKIPHWTGRPKQPPSAKAQGDNLYVSWNGATEVVAWELQGSRSRQGDAFDRLQKIEKRRFEETFALPPRNAGYKRFRAVALDAAKKPLGTSEPVERGSAAGPSVLGVVVGVVAVVAAALAVWYGLRLWARGGRISFPLSFPGGEEVKRWFGSVAGEKYSYTRL